MGPDLAEAQFGFRRGRSTVDAIMRLGALAKEEMRRGGVTLAVSLDIANAFNTLPWSCIREALVYHRVPTYLRRVVGAYLTDRAVIYPGQEFWDRREMSCGVPQGSVLGPLLWNIGYDWVLRGDLPGGASVLCYADDTLVLARGETHRAAADIAADAVATVVDRIRRLGLEVALHKTEAMAFHGPRNAPPPGSSIMVGEVHVGIESTMKYLGLVLDSRWNFRDHFRLLAPKLEKAAAALKRLLPNIGGPDASCRRLYAGVVRSMALYGAPVWSAEGGLAAANRVFLRRAQRAVAVRIIRGYRTISFEAASLLAGTPPWDLEAGVLATLYNWRREELSRGRCLAPQQIAARRTELRRDLMAVWEQRLWQPTAGHASIEAVRPVLTEWLERRHGALTFRLTQVLSKHGKFGRFLHRIGEVDSPGCLYCPEAPEDTVQHTVEVCPRWALMRRVLVEEIGGDLSLPALVRSMVRSESAWTAVASFCEAVMARKEEVDWLRQRSSRPGGRRRGRPAQRRRRARDDLQPP